MKPFHILMGLTALFLSCGVASANSCLNTCVTYDASTPTTEADFYGNGFLLPFSHFEYISLPAFNPALGTLTSVTISISAASGANTDCCYSNEDPTKDFYENGMPSTLDVMNPENQDPEWTASWIQNVTLSMYLLSSNAACAGDVVNTTHTEATAPCLLASLTPETPGAILSYSGETGPVGQGGSVITPLNFSASLTTSVNSLLWADFIGTGNLAMPLFAETSNTSFNSAGNGSTSAVIFVGANASITYDYTPFQPEVDISPTPEPASMFLMGGALVSLGLLRKRFRRQ